MKEDKGGASTWKKTIESFGEDNGYLTVRCNFKQNEGRVYLTGTDPWESRSDCILKLMDLCLTKNILGRWVVYKKES